MDEVLNCAPHPKTFILGFLMNAKTLIYLEIIVELPLEA